MAQPSTSLDFTGGTQTDPGTTKRNTTGYVPAEKVPSQHLNWYFGNVSAWITYLKNLAGEALTWSAKHTFSAGLASGTAASSANDLVRLNEAATKNMSGGVLSSLGNGVASGDAVNKGQLDAVAGIVASGYISTAGTLSKQKGPVTCTNAGGAGAYNITIPGLTTTAVFQVQMVGALASGYYVEAIPATGVLAVNTKNAGGGISVPISFIVVSL
jgi:hypothetical protein